MLFLQLLSCIKKRFDPLFFQLLAYIKNGLTHCFYNYNPPLKRDYETAFRVSGAAHLVKADNVQYWIIGGMF